MNAFQRAWLGIKNQWRLQLLSIFSVSVAFVCLGAFLLVVFNIAELHRDWATRGQLSVYLRDGAPPEAVGRIMTALNASPEVAEVMHITRANARERVLQHEADDLLAALPEAAFPESLEVRLTPISKERSIQVEVEAVTSKLKELPAVEAVQTYEVWTRRLLQLIKNGLIACGLLFLVVLLAVMSVVGSTIRLTLERRKDEVQVMKLVGAADSYVSRPFLIEGAMQGGLGAMGALSLLCLLFLIGGGEAVRELTRALGTPIRFLSPTLCAAMVLVGVLLGTLAAHLSLRRMLRI
jgi:cell division transport system permease protein